MVAASRASDVMTTVSRPTILYVDPDRVSSLITTRVLERMGCDVECVTDATSALEILQQQRVDLVLCEATLPDLPAAAFIAHAHRIYPARTLPIIALGVDLPARSRVELLRAGAAECLAKPIEADELRLRVERLLTIRSAPLEPTRDVALSGLLEHVALADLLTMLELARLTGHIEIATRRLAGRIELDGGHIRHAALGDEVGLAALADLLRLAEGWFRVRTLPPSGAPTMGGSTTQILLHASVAQAHRRRGPSDRTALLHDLGVSTARGSTRPEPPRRAARILPLLMDPHRLGELEVGLEPALAADAPLIVTLFGDRTEAVTALWEISAPLAPRDLVEAMRPGAALRWTFCGRDQDRLLVRIVALDEPSPSWFDRPSDAVVLAVPAGGAHAIDPAVRAYVHTHQMPTVIVAEPAEGERLLSPAPFTAVSVTGQRLPQLRGGIRAALVAAVRLRSQS